MLLFLPIVVVAGRSPKDGRLPPPLRKATDGGRAGGKGGKGGGGEGAGGKTLENVIGY